MLKTCFVMLVAPALMLASDALGQHIGRLKPLLVPVERVMGRELLPVPLDGRLIFHSQIEPDARLFVGEAPLGNGKSIKLGLVEPSAGEPYVFADLNFNGAFDDNERYSFSKPTAKRLVSYPEVILNVGTKLGPFSSYPVRVLMPGSRIYTNNPRGKNGRYLLVSLGCFVQGTFDLDGKPVLSIYYLNPSNGDVSPTSWQGMDCNGDGWIDESGNSEEFAMANNETVIFRVNGHDLSTVSINLNDATFVVKEHVLRDANRISLRVGEVLPSFDFTDIDRKPHNLSELGGKFVLLDFWATWCSPCLAELPNLERAWQHFRNRDLIVLGICDDDADLARRLLQQKGITYLQALGLSALELVRSRFRVDAFPTVALIDKSGRVLLVNDPSLRGDRLQPTLDKLLPPAR